MISDFILEFDDFMTPKYCTDAIKFFEMMRQAGFTSYRGGKTKHMVEDNYIGLGEFKDDEITKLGIPTASTHTFLEKFWKDVYPIYKEKYSILEQCQDHAIVNLKLQRTVPGEAYHTWHFETASQDVAGRIMTFILYLNDIEDGGETEFLYYPKRIKPKQGKLVLFPGGFTHTHRGNQPLNGPKYIITGWVEY
jgi:2OG-Fe(II) oxygenase superfamily